MIPGRKTPFFKTLFQNILNGTLEKSLPAIQGLEAFIRHVPRTRVPCGGCQARSKAQGSGPCPAGVRGFKSHPPHHQLVSPAHYRLRLLVSKALRTGSAMLEDLSVLPDSSQGMSDWP